MGPTSGPLLSGGWSVGVPGALAPGNWLGASPGMSCAGSGSVLRSRNKRSGRLMAKNAPGRCWPKKAAQSAKGCGACAGSRARQCTRAGCGGSDQGLACRVGQRSRPASSPVKRVTATGNDLDDVWSPPTNLHSATASTNGRVLDVIVRDATTSIQNTHRPCVECSGNLNHSRRGALAA